MLLISSLSITESKIFKVSEASPEIQAWLRAVFQGAAPYFVLGDEASIQEARIVQAWKVFDRQRRPFEARFSERVYQDLQACGRAVLEDFRVSGSFNPTLFDQVFRPRFNLTLQVLHDSVARHFIPLAPGRVTQKAEFDLVEPADYPEMVRYFNLTTAQKVTAVSSYTKTLISTIIEQGFRDGLPIPEITDRLSKSFGFSKVRAERIARTEVIATSNAATFFGVSQNIPAAGLTKDWIATKDRRTRPTHVQAGIGQKNVPNRDPFQVGGARLMFPGDTSLGAPGREVINCFPGDTLLSAPDVKLAYKRWYKGSVIRIETEFGDKLTGTPNHPVFTKRGWLPLQELQETDYVLRTANPERVLVGSPNVQGSDSTFAQVFNTLSELGETQGVSGRDVDFHGDGTDEQVNIVGSNRYLVSTDDPSFQEHVLKVELMRRGLGQGSLSPLCDSVGVAIFHRPTPEGAIGRLYEELSSLRGEGFHTEPVTLGDGPALDSELVQPSQDVLVIGPELASKHFQREAAFVKVSSLQEEAFTGWVYNAHTQSQVYLANGIVCQNCRCAIAFTMPPVTF